MEWDWHQFTPLSTPTFGNNHNNSHFQDAFSPYMHQKHDSAASSSSAIDQNGNYVAAYPQPPQCQNLHQQQMQQQQHRYQQQQEQQYPQQQQCQQQQQYPQQQEGQQQQQQHQQQQYSQQQEGQQQQQQHNYASPMFAPNFPQDVFQMQTPPPTRGSSTKRRSLRPPENATVDQSGMRQPDFTPLAFNFAPVSAVQQTNMSWNQPSDMASAIPQVAPPAWNGFAEDPFAQWSTRPCPVIPPAVHSDEPAPTNPLAYPTPTPAKKNPVTSSLDPSLLFSSPGNPVIHKPAPAPAPAPAPNAKPCLAPAFPSRSSSISPVKAASGLHRSNTTGGLKPSPSLPANNPLASGFLSRSNSAVNLPRRSSPLKRTARASLSSISETAKPPVRTSVVLTIDANGTARTETRVIEESPTRSIKDKYPALWDESDSDSDAVAGSKWPSRNSSLAHDRGKQERQAKVAKLDPPAEIAEAAQLPRSNSTASLKTPSKPAYPSVAQLRRQNSAKKQQRSTTHNRRNTLSSLNSSFENLAAMDLNKDEKHTQNDAGSALRQQAVAKRVSSPAQPLCSNPVRPTPCRTQSDQHVNQTRPSSQQVQQNQHQQPAQQPQLQPQMAHHFQAPTNSHHYTHAKSQSVSYPISQVSAPMFDPRGGSFPVSAPMALASVPISFTNDMSSMTRCICHIPIDDGRLVQCGLCTMWSHSGCVGVLDPLNHAQFICAFCVNPLHPVRSSSMQNFNTWAVPGL